MRTSVAAGYTSSSAGVQTSSRGFFCGVSVRDPQPATAITAAMASDATKDGETQAEDASAQAAAEAPKPQAPRPEAPRRKKKRFRRTRRFIRGVLLLIIVAGVAAGLWGARW